MFLALMLLTFLQADPVVTAGPFQTALVEGDSWTFVVSRDGSISQPLTINFMVGNSAEPFVDYSPTLAGGYPAYGQLTFQAGQGSMTFNVQSYKSGRYRPVFFQFQLLQGTGYQVGAPNAAIAGLWTKDQYTLQCQLGFATKGCNTTLPVVPPVQEE